MKVGRKMKMPDPKAQQMLGDLELIAAVVADYKRGRRRGLSDDETEQRAWNAFCWAMEIIQERFDEQYEVGDVGGEQV